jgi:putative FmdB family regulatory protein
MPIYEYKCQDCGEVNEFLTGIGRNSDDLVCRACGSARLESQMSSPAISMGKKLPSLTEKSTCCGSAPSEKGCRPGGCCGSH